MNDSYGDWVGHQLDKPFDVAPLWYLIACGLRYLTRSDLPLRVLNLIFSSLAVAYTGVFTQTVYGDKAARCASLCLALLPLPVFYSCFVFKEQLVMLLTMILLCHAVLIRAGRFHPLRLLGTGAAALALLLTRSGVSVALLALCVLFALWKPGTFARIRRGDKRLVILLIAALILAAAAVALLFPTIRHKLEYYLSGNAVLEGVSIRFIDISVLKDLYKLPLTWFYAMLSPISLFQSFQSYYDVVCMLDVTLIPVAAGAALYLTCKKRDPLVTFGCLAYFLISAVPSIAIFRHYFSLLPITLSAFGAFTQQMDRRRKWIWIALSAAVFALIFAYYLWRNVLRS